MDEKLMKNGIAVMTIQEADGTFTAVLEEYHDGIVVEGKQKKGFKSEQDAVVAGTKYAEFVVQAAIDEGILKNVRLHHIKEASKEAVIH